MRHFETGLDDDVAAEQDEIEIEGARRVWKRSLPAEGSFDCEEQVEHLEETLGLGDTETGPPGPSAKLTLPSEADVDKAFDYLERQHFLVFRAEPENPEEPMR